MLILRHQLDANNPGLNAAWDTELADTPLGVCAGCPDLIDCFQCNASHEAMFRATLQLMMALLHLGRCPIAMEMLAGKLDEVADIMYNGACGRKNETESRLN